MKLRKQTAALLTGAMAAMLLMSGCGQARIGYIDAERVMEAPQMKTLTEEGEQKYKEAVEEAQQKMAATKDMSQEEAQKVQQDVQRKLAGLNQSYALQMRQKLDAAVGAVSREQELDAVVSNTQEQPIAVSGCIDITDATIGKLQ